ncbi:MAG: endospore germination permease [Firmicutes bacterium]|nr:endospore germination permease [Dethiobacter sp.]MBS3887882.1 endospore germination permease [Bacillota bacterium]MBS4053707.1 endospore germination permease [Thermaerobacter sp.]
MTKATKQISARQLMFLKLTGIIGVLFFGAIRLVTGIAGAQGIMAIAGGAVLSMLILYLAVSVAKMFPDHTPFEYAKLIYGRWLGSLIALSLVVFNLLIGTMVLRDLGDFLISAILPETPLSANIALMLGLVCFGVYLGLESLARFNEGFAPLILLSWLIVIVAGLLRADFGWLRPLLAVEPSQLMLSTLVSGSIIIDGLIVLLFFSFVKDQGSVLKYNTWAIIMATVIMAGAQVAVVTSLSPNLAQTVLYPILELARNTPLGAFLERIEALYLAVWIMGTFIKIAVLFYGSCLGLATTTGVKNYRTFIIPIAALSFYFSFQADNIVQSSLFEAMFHHYAPFYEAGLLLLLLLGGLWVGKTGRGRIARGT